MNLSTVPKETLRLELIKFSTINNIKFPAEEHGINIQDEIIVGLKNAYHNTPHTDLSQAMEKFNRGDTTLKSPYRMTLNWLGSLLKEQLGANQLFARQKQNRHVEPDSFIDPELYEEIMKQGVIDAKKEWMAYQNDPKRVLFVKRYSTLHSYLQNKGQILDSNGTSLQKYINVLNDCHHAITFKINNKGAIAKNDIKDLNTPFYIQEKLSHKLDSEDIRKGAEVLYSLLGG